MLRPGRAVDVLAQLYRGVMTGLLDRHCPVVTLLRRARPMTPWFDAECRDARGRATAQPSSFRRPWPEPLREDFEGYSGDVPTSTSGTGR